MRSQFQVKISINAANEFQRDLMLKTFRPFVDALISTHQQNRAELVITQQEKCSACSGSGYYDSHGSPPCGGCNGKGSIKQRLVV